MKTLTNSLGAYIAILGLSAALVLGMTNVANAQNVLFTSDLTVGSTGTQVTALQSFLIQKGYSIPAGATGYFGAQTRAAVAAYQAANGIVPPAGYFGPLTRAKVNATSVTNPPSNNDDDEDNDADTSGLRGGEASLERYRVSEGDDSEVEEGGTAEVAEIEFRVEDGDVRLNRLDLTFDPAGGNGEDEPWKAFDTIRLIADGKEIAEADVSDEDDWLDDDAPYVFRFSGLKHVVREGKTAHIVVEVEAQNGVVDSSMTDTWTVYVDEDGIRATDSEGLTQETGDASETADFDLVEEGDGEELTVRSSSEDPEASVLQVEDDGRSDWYTLFVFDLEADENDIELNDFAVDFTTGTADVEDIIDDVQLVIDGEEFDDFDWNGTGTFASTTFDIDGDYAVEDGDRVEVEVMARFKSANGVNYSPGETIQASVDGMNIEGEGADDLVADGSATGDTHTLQVSGITVSRTDRSAQSTSADGADNDYATFTVEVNVTALEQDVFIPIDSADAFTFQIENASTGAIIGTSTATTSSLTANASTQGNFYRVNEGQTKSFEFMVTFNPLPENESGNYRMKLLTIEFADTASTPDQTWTALPASTYQTQSTYIND